MKIQQLHQYFLESSGICTDTRKITDNCLFFALRGDNFDGNKFAQEALDKGALKVVIDDMRYHKNTGETILHGNSLQLLQKLATYHRSYLGIPVISLTGSNGKTTTKELINAVLSQKFKTSATLGNLNNHIGVPITLLSMTKQTEIGIVEMGANHLKEIELLSDIALPDFGYITNFGKAHIEGFGSLEGVIQGKSELYKHIKEHDKVVFVNANDAKQLELTQTLNRITFGKEGTDYAVSLLNATDKLKVRFKNQDIQTHLIGVYNFHNIAAAIAIGNYFKVTPSKIKRALESYIPSMNRSQIIEQNGHNIILDAYNANPTSMLAALENFKQTKGTSKVMILGDMFELGCTAKTEHQEIVNFLEKHIFGKVFLVGENFFGTTVTSGHISKYESYDLLEKMLLHNKIPPSKILLKGSRGMALERTLDHL